MKTGLRRLVWGVATLVVVVVPSVGEAQDGVTRTGYFDAPGYDMHDWRLRWIDRAAAEADLVVLDSLLRYHYAYNDADRLDETAMLERIRAALPDRIRLGDFAMQLQKALAHSIDGHAPRVSGQGSGGAERIEDHPPGNHFLPFEVRSTGSRIVAFDVSDPRRRVLIDEERPYLAEIDGWPVSTWIEAAQSIIVDGTDALRWHRGARHLANVGFLRMEMGHPMRPTAELVFENEDRSQSVTRTVELSDVSVAVAHRYPVAEDARSRVPSDVAYFRIMRMEGGEDFAEDFAAWIQESRDALGAVIDIRDNGGGSRLPLITLLPHVLAPDAAPVVVAAGKLKLPPECEHRRCEMPPEGYLANRYMLPRDAIPEGSREREALEAWLPSFTPRWSPPEATFSPWHYLVIGPDPDPVFAGKPVVILMNNGNFSASDIFLSGFKGRENVTLLGTASSGGSARQGQHPLPNSGLGVRLATMASFQGRNAELYDGVGIHPDIHMEPEPGFFVNASDDVLERAIRIVRGGRTPGDEEE